jgi:hypothetical protein
MDEYNKRPYGRSKEFERKIGHWLQMQHTNLINNIKSMKNDTLKKMYIDFLNDDKYKEYFMSNEECWIYKLELVKKFIDTHNRKPQSRSKDKNERTIGRWLITQSTNYNSDLNL